MEAEDIRFVNEVNDVNVLKGITVPFSTVFYTVFDGVLWMPMPYLSFTSFIVYEI